MITRVVTGPEHRGLSMSEQVVWIKVVPAAGWEVQSRSMAASAAEVLHTALHSLDVGAYAEVLTTEEASDDLRASEALDE